MKLLEVKVHFHEIEVSYMSGIYVQKNHEVIQKVHEIDRTNLITSVGRFMK
jgi:hypothetical protein